MQQQQQQKWKNEKKKNTRYIPWPIVCMRRTIPYELYRLCPGLVALAMASIFRGKNAVANLPTCPRGFFFASRYTEYEMMIGYL